jgi:hypothetical protein
MTRRVGAACVLSLMVCGVAYAQESVVSLKLGQRHKIDKAATIEFVAVSSDSRCPQGVNCIQAGEATVELSLVQDEKPIPVTLATSPQERSSADAGGRKIVLKSLLPDPPPVGGAGKKYELSVSVSPSGGK